MEGKEHVSLDQASTPKRKLCGSRETQARSHESALGILWQKTAVSGEIERKHGPIYVI